jgi:hypothetical protein
MAQLRISKGKSKVIEIFEDIMDYTFIIKVEILDIIKNVGQEVKKVMFILLITSHIMISFNIKMQK